MSRRFTRELKIRRRRVAWTDTRQTHLPVNRRTNQIARRAKVIDCGKGQKSSWRREKRGDRQQTLSNVREAPLSVCRYGEVMLIWCLEVPGLSVYRSEKMVNQRRLAMRRYRKRVSNFNMARVGGQRAMLAEWRQNGGDGGESWHGAWREESDS